MVRRYDYPTKCQPPGSSSLPLAVRANTRRGEPHELPKLILRPKVGNLQHPATVLTEKDTSTVLVHEEAVL